MQLHGEQRLYSATDLVSFLSCEHLTALAFQVLSDRALAALRVGNDESAALIAQKGDEHERAYLRSLQEAGRQVVVVDTEASLEGRERQTLEAMAAGAEVIYQATLRDGPWVGHADFLRRIDGESSVFGSWRYEVADTKLARSPKAKFLVQLAFYSQLVAKAQSAEPRMMHVVLGDGSERAFRCADYMHYFEALQARFLAYVSGLGSGAASPPYPVPCEHCDLCDWRELCAQRRLADDHLSQVAGVTRVQTVKLEAAGISTMAKLATLPFGASVSRMHVDTLGKLRGQAELQHEAKCTGKRRVKLLELDPEARRGFYRLPEPDIGDMFFDMEGDPLEIGGLEYLFGLWCWEEGGWAFKSFWAHDRAQERVAFEQFMDFVQERRRQFPRAHVYHYASYEETALKRLASFHATREVEMDNLLRHGVLVDLYKVVREGLRISESSYSIKYVERFYRPAREGDVQNAGASIVYYERWRETGDPKLIEDIAAYNRDDVESTQQLRDWLLGLRPEGLPWREAATAEPAKDAAEPTAVQQIELRLAEYRGRLVDPLPTDPRAWGLVERASELTYQLLDFHRRAAKPEWWALFARMDFDEQELMDDPECLAGLKLDPEAPPTRVARSMLYTYRAPEQETKLADGDQVTRCDTGESIGSLMFDEATRTVQIKLGPSKQPLPDRLSIGPSGPIDSRKISAALFRFADRWLAGERRYDAVEQLLRRDVPRLRGRVAGEPVVQDVPELVPGCIAAVRALASSYLYVQGPPGSGKTYSGSRMIAALLADGYRVGIMSNSHKAIHHLMAGAILECVRQRVDVQPVKKATSGRDDTELQVDGAAVSNLYTNADVWVGDGNLIGGTAWLFCDEAADQQLDYLFVDEAGQVALANLVAAGTCARNLVLLGDQMQLSQPVQGVHPGRSGDSALDYLLDGAATIAPDRGIFLATSWRMHPEVCRFISDAVYDGRLAPEAANAICELELDSEAHPFLKRAGIVHVPVEHEGCSQGSDVEAQLVAEIYANALSQRYTDRDGVMHPMTPENILVVAPYNVQVNLLRKTLPDGARVGTVDKFQGQEAELVIVSMTTSSEQDLPRNIEFLYSKNRLNVAVSRAKCLAIVLANPALLTIKCRTPEQMTLVNTLCWMARVGAEDLDAGGGCA